MGLFSRKKEDKKDIKSDLPRFPQFHEEFPKYESAISQEDISTIKSAVNTEDRPPIPLKKMTFATVPLKEESSMSELPKGRYEDDIKMPYMEMSATSESSDNYKQDKTLFVKI